MFAFRKQNLYGQAATAAYQAIMAQVGRPEFYARYGIPDTFDGRFDLMVLHLFLVMDPLTARGAAERDFNQALFDAAFANMDQTLREMGIGDMGVPKHMRRMMKAFNGRVHAYHQAFAAATDDALESALRRNVYAVSDQAAVAGLPALMAYIRRCRAMLTDPQTILQGAVVFPEL